MKRFLLIALAIVLVFSLGACMGDDTNGPHIGNKEAGFDENATENLNIANNAGTLSIDEDTVRELLSPFSAEQTGLSADVYDYMFTLSEATFNGQSACKAEAFLVGEDGVKGIFFISGNVCYRYDNSQNKYYLLTAGETIEIEAQVQVKNEEQETESSNTPSTTVRTPEDVADDNNSVMHKRFAKYDLSGIGLTKDISEYDFQMTSKPVTTIDGTTAYVVYLMENGQYTNFTFAFSPEKDYYYDREADEYKPLS